MEHEIDRIECAIRHIESSLDVDPWACEIAVHAMKELIKRTRGWIPVTEALPEHSGFYIVTAIVTDDGGKLVGLRWFSQEHGWKFGKNPLAWMPLPEPYKEGQDETN